MNLLLGDAKVRKMKDIENYKMFFATQLITDKSANEALDLFDTKSDVQNGNKHKLITREKF